MTMALALNNVDESGHRRDANPDRVKAWKETLSKARKFYFLDEFGNYLHLQHLGTHPDYQRHGAGSALSKWGTDLAQKHNPKVGLFASPMGKFLYTHLEFNELAAIVVRVPCEEGSVTVSAMIWGLKCGGEDTP